MPTYVIGIERYDTTPMWLFRRSLDPSLAESQPVAFHDLHRISHLLRAGGKRYHALTESELPDLVSQGLGVQLVATREIWGVALVARPASGTSWLRTVAFADGLDVAAGAAQLMPALHETMRAHGVSDLYYAGDDASDRWLAPLLKQQHYQYNTEVLVYEKHNLDIPDRGNLYVQVRPATAVDLAEILRIDRRCFEPHWTKDDIVLGPAIQEGPFFIVAELGRRIVGYAYATAHFGGRLIHLVRIAVDPPFRSGRIGIRLLAELTDYAQQQGAHVISLNTQAYNRAAQQLYRWFGFHTTGERMPVLHYADRRHT
jgi:ribosomal-protein-alanine N-acetyltransferase